MRKIYVNPGELVEVRIVGCDTEKTSRGWSEQVFPSSMLVSFDHDFLEVGVGVSVKRNGVFLGGLSLNKGVEI